MKVFILGGDGFCGWPTSLHLSNLGHEVVIIDNLSRRNIDNELGATSLTPIAPIDQRIASWKEVSSHELGFYNLNLATEYERFLAVLEAERPDAIVHFAEQRAAPYSMKSPRHKRYTVDNNVSATKQRALRRGRVGSRRSYRALRHDGRVRLRHRRDEDS